MRFDLTDLQLFLHVAEAGSITAGAGRAHLALASASARIRDMEDLLGTPLLSRGRRGVELTAAGRTLARHARAVLQQMDRMRGELSEHARGLKGRVRLLSNTAALTEFLPDALGAFLAAHPNVDIDLEERMSHDIVRAIAEGWADIGIVSDAVDPGALQRIPFRVDRLVAIGAHGHPLFKGAARGRRGIAFAQLLDCDFVGLAADSALAQYLDGHAARDGRRIRYRARLHGFDAVCRMVESGAGIGVVPQTAALRCAQSMAIRSIRLSDPWAQRQLMLCVRSIADLPSYARKLIEALTGPPPAPENMGQSAADRQTSGIGLVASAPRERPK